MRGYVNERHYKAIMAGDVGRDMRCHVDTEGHVYDYAFGMNWSGVINDPRVEIDR